LGSLNDQKNDEIVRINKRVLSELSMKNPSFIVSKIIEYIKLADNSENNQKFMSYLNILVDILNFADKSKQVSLENSLIELTKSVILKVN
jgi:chromosome condensin MukBEF MukE localization factor